MCYEIFSLYRLFPSVSKLAIAIAAVLWSLHGLFSKRSSHHDFSSLTSEQCETSVFRAEGEI